MQTLNITREQIEKTWEVYGTGVPLTPEFVDELVELVNRPVEYPKTTLRLKPTEYPMWYPAPYWNWSR